MTSDAALTNTTSSETEVPMRSRKIPIVIIFIALLILPHAALGADLPIDIDAFGRQDEEQQDALTVRYSFDLFSETSATQNEAIAARRELAQAEAERSIFTEPHAVDIVDPNEMLLQAAIENQIFSEPMQSRRFTQVEEDEDIPLWVMIPVLVGAAGLGLIIAIRRTSKKKERETNVHHNHR